jgi:4,5-DOPA dioxygenase extradiol
MTMPQPAFFVGHGSPMNALESNRYTRAWADLATGLPERPRAILSISAHWFINATAVTAMAAPRTIHDFFGFPQDLFDTEYGAPGDPDLARRIVELADPVWVGLDVDSWGIDHGTWSVLIHLFPEADIPVLQLSIDAHKPVDYHVELGRKLEQLRHEGVLVLGTGNVVHNLGLLDRSQPEGGEPWAHRFDQTARELLTTRPGDIAELAEHPDFALAAPTPDHLLPVLYLGGLADAAGLTAEVLIDGMQGGSLSMASYQVG